jgi:hypothetical protein
MGGRAFFCTRDFENCAETWVSVEDFRRESAEYAGQEKGPDQMVRADLFVFPVLKLIAMSNESFHCH